ncbi:MAG: RnfABCDGE type electron transport complex subunit A [Candidatus Omnitrophica bacterium]|nr:RnfABCDGE type electron transport complex subunit A [Candidatus Omnitrophota bacterium]
MEYNQLLMIAISVIFINNFILSKFLGLCPFIGVSKSTRPALYMGLAVTFVMTASSIITWGIYSFLLKPFHIEYLRTLSFILVIASFVQLIEMFIQKFSPALYKIFGIYLALITTNCAVFGVAVLNSEMFLKVQDSFVKSFIFCLTQGFCAGVGFTIVLLFMSGIRERLEFCDIPRPMKDMPIAFIVASLMSMAFMGFSGFRF